MVNKEFITLLNDAADLEDILGKVWEPRAYRRAAQSIENLSEDLDVIYRTQGRKGLEAIDGVGRGIALKIIEFIETKGVKEFELLQKKIPAGVLQMMRLQGIGPKKAFRLYNEMNVRSIDELKKAGEKGKIAKLRGFGEKSQQEMMLSIARTFRDERRLLGEVLPIAGSLRDELQKNPFVNRVEVAGSIRRMKETVKDIDILVLAKDDAKVIDFFIKLPSVVKVLVKGPTKVSVVLNMGLNCDVRVVPEKSFGAAWAYFTGSKEHNIRMRQIALKQGKKLSEYGVFAKGKYLAGKTEDEVYKNLGLPWIPPEIRENTGELLLKKTPALVEQKDLRGDCHMHTTWSDGRSSSEEMIRAAIDLGYEYIAITDHSQSTHIAKGLDLAQLKKHHEELELLQKKFSQIHILKSGEVDILDHGLDYPKKVLQEFDFVIASIHSSFKSSEEMMTQRIVSAIESGVVHCIAHPFGRRLLKREPYKLDFPRILEAAKKYHVALEVNSNPERLDLNGAYVKQAIDAGVNVMVNSDAHVTIQLSLIRFGVGQARKGWAEKKHVLNTLPWKDFEKMLKR